MTDIVHEFQIEVACCPTGLLLTYYGFLILWGVSMCVFLVIFYFCLFVCLFSKERDTERKAVELGEWGGVENLIGVGES